MTPTLLPPRVPLVDSNGCITREWYRYLDLFGTNSAYIDAAVEELTMSASKVLFNAKQAENVETTQYTCPANKRTIIDSFTGTNTTGGAVTFTVKLVQSGSTPGVLNTIVSAKSIASNDCYTFPEMVGQVMSAGDFISTVAAAASSITIRCSGREVA